MVKIDLSLDVLKRDPYPDDSIILIERTQVNYCSETEGVQVSTGAQTKIRNQMHTHARTHSHTIKAHTHN